MLTLPFDRSDPLMPPAAYTGLPPVAEVSAPDGRRAWLVTSFDAVTQVLTDARFEVTPPGAEAAADTLLQDGEAHARLRRLVARAFAPRAIEALRPRIERIADERTAAFAEAAEPDLVMFAAAMSAGVIGDLLRVSIGDQGRFHALVGAVSGDFTDEAAKAWNELTEMAGDLVEQKRHALGDDLLSALIGVHDARDGRLSAGELVGVVTTIVAAGHQTARNAIAVGTLLLATEGRLAGLAAAPEQDAVVEEVLRRLAGLIAEPFPRWARERVEVAGVPIEAGDLVIVRLEAANHDPARFEEPGRFAPGREGGHVSFGRGPHHCLGAALARIELTAALRALSTRVPGLRPGVAVEDLVWRHGLTDAGPVAVPVRFS
ncbi:cytochrome P450 [Actinomadura sp. WMMB 499]|uniref:cytochrome P450 n=1 Tax=Actinomadura sp. WMMB 499 TaxID=1219491 RepID=UPI001247485A|nr:cytochrome P450 [Actinomadura sp. WMMB 499]QFG21932.1 cytochrome P450 [Actinomadura sp. WMMB 499]